MSGVVVPQMVISKQIGWMKCVACSDATKTRPGQMWIGVNRAGVDEWITCPVCKGTQQVARLQHYDMRTGEPIHS